MSEGGSVEGKKRAGKDPNAVCGDIRGYRKKKV